MLSEACCPPAWTTLWYHSAATQSLVLPGEARDKHGRHESWSREASCCHRLRVLDEFQPGAARETQILRRSGSGTVGGVGTDGR